MIDVRVLCIRISCTAIGKRVSSDNGHYNAIGQTVIGFRVQLADVIVLLAWAAYGICFAHEQ